MDLTAFDLDCELSADPASVPELRQLVATLVAVPAAGTPQGDDIRLAVTEAVTNVVLHAYVDEPARGRVRLRAVLRDAALVVVISDTGRGITPRHDSPGLGVGMALMSKLSDELDVRSDAEGSTITMRFALGAQS